MHAPSLFLSLGTRRPDGDAARDGIYPDEGTWRLGDGETGLTARRAKGQELRVGLQQRNVVTAFGHGSLRQRNVVTAFGHGSLRQWNVATAFRHGRLPERNVATAFRHGRLPERNVATAFRHGRLPERNVAATFGLRRLRRRNVRAFWHLGGGLGLQCTRGGCLRP